MGIVIRSSFWQSTINFMVAIVGFINNIYIFQLTLTKEELGVITVLQEAPQVFVPFVMLGAGSIMIRYYPYFKKKHPRHNGLLLFGVLALLAGSVIVVSIFFIFHSFFVDFFTERSPVFEPYVPLVIVMSILMAYAILFFNYVSNSKKLVVPTIMNRALVVVLLPIVCILYYYDVIDFHELIIGQVIIYALVLVGIVWYSIKIKIFSLKPNFEGWNRKEVKEMLTFGFWGFLALVGGPILNKFDILMVNSQINIGEAAVYRIADKVAYLILLPKVAMVSIVQPIIAEKWASKDFKELNVIYKKSSINLLLIALYLFGGTILCLDALYGIMADSEAYEAGKTVVIILGLVKVVDLGTGLGGIILSYSKFYRFVFILIIVMAGANIILNYHLIPIFQTNGAALATLIALGVSNFLVIIYNQIKFKLQPFTKETLWAILVALVSVGAIYFIFNFENNYLTILVKGTSFTLVFWLLAYFLKVSVDINGVIQTQILNRIIK